MVELWVRRDHGDLGGWLRVRTQSLEHGRLPSHRAHVSRIEMGR
jgi:hypothetical protein